MLSRGQSLFRPQSVFCGLSLHWSWQDTDCAWEEQGDSFLGRKICGYFATPNCPKPEGFHSGRNVIAPSVTKTWRCLQFCKTDSGWSLWQESLSHARIDSNPLISLRKTYSLHVLLITQEGRPCSACSRIQLIILPSVFLLWEQTRATLLGLLVVKASSGLSMRCS